MAIKEPQTVTPEGERLVTLPEGAVLRDLVTHVDERGSLCEIIDERWPEAEEPITSSFLWTIRPGVIKAWNLHDETVDRYAVVFGEVEVVLYDDREDSSTRGVVSQLILTELRRQYLVIPNGVWHGMRGLGQRDAVLINFPTVLYDHVNPDKHRLPVVNDLIPFTFSSP
jgi:dTDP-4-dehydrorhamnose 3,5-epimerase